MNVYLRFRLWIDNNVKVAPQLLEGPHARRKKTLYHPERDQQMIGNLLIIIMSRKSEGFHVQSQCCFIRPWKTNSGLLLPHQMKLLPNVRCHDNWIRERKICLWTRKRPSAPWPLFDSCQHCRARGWFSYTSMPILNPERSPLSNVL